MGHSQGALHSHRLIANKIQGTELQKRFICAYAIGYMIPEKHYASMFPLIPQSQSPIDTNCIISWSTVVEGFKRERERTEHMFINDKTVVYIIYEKICVENIQ